jgi:hypothetical protein
MYSPAIAEALRELGHDAVSVHDRSELAAAADTLIFTAMQAERRAIVTNNVRDFVPLAQQALQTGTSFSGLIFTSDKSLPRTTAMIGTFVRHLDALLQDRPAEDALLGQVHWLTRD